MNTQPNWTPAPKETLSDDGNFVPGSNPAAGAEPFTQEHDRTEEVQHQAAYAGILNKEGQVYPREGVEASMIDYMASDFRNVLGPAYSHVDHSSTAEALTVQLFEHIGFGTHSVLAQSLADISAKTGVKIETQHLSSHAVHTITIPVTMPTDRAFEFISELASGLYKTEPTRSGQPSTKVVDIASFRQQAKEELGLDLTEDQAHKLVKLAQGVAPGR